MRLSELMEDNDPCWDGYEQYGTKKKDGKEVPNCVPTDEAVEEGENDQVDGGDPCWDGYEMVGMKKKGGKEVPNCVPANESDLSEEDIKKPHPKLQKKVKELMAKGYDRRQAIRKAEELTGMKNEAKKAPPKKRSAEARAAWEMGKQSGGAHDTKKYTKKDRRKAKVDKRDVDESEVKKRAHGHTKAKKSKPSTNGSQPHGLRGYQVGEQKK